MFKKLLNLITFADLPIRRKFILFSLGVLFWFAAMFAVNIAAYFAINDKMDRMEYNVVPYDRVAHKTTRKLQSLSIDAVDIMTLSDPDLIDRKFDASRARLLDLKTFLSAITLGGQINDIDRRSDTLVEIIPVMPSSGFPVVREYAKTMKPMIADLDIKLSELEDIKSGILNGQRSGSSQLMEKTGEYREMITRAVAATINYSAKIASLHDENLEDIRGIIDYSLFAFGGVLFIATGLLVLFTITISSSITSMVRSVIEQIRSLGTGKVDLSRKIEVRSKDEIGTLSEEFNVLTEEIHDIVTFKKVIEEDDSLEDVYSRLGRAFINKLGLDQFIIYEVSNDQKKMKPVYPIMLNDKDIFCSEDILTNCTLCKVEKTGHIISSITYPEICRQFKPDLDKEHICFPMIIGGRTGGVVQFLFDRQDISIEKKDKRLFKAEQYIKESISVIEAKRLTNTLKDSAIKDSLTGLYNRRFLQEYTETLVAGALRRQKTVGLIMCDLDFFKQVNDLYGHNVGDHVLKETSRIITNCVRSSDLVIRFGGEEFLVVTLDTNEGDTLNIAEKIREAVETAKIKVSDGTIKKTISLGVSEFPADTESFWQAIKFADVALYKAKDGGRNQAVRFTEEMWSQDEF